MVAVPGEHSGDQVHKVDFCPCCSTFKIVLQAKVTKLTWDVASDPVQIGAIEVGATCFPFRTISVFFAAPDQKACGADDAVHCGWLPCACVATVVI